MRRHSEFIGSIILVLMSVGLTLGAAELGCRLVYPEGFYRWRPNPDVHTTSEFSYRIIRNSWGVRDREFKAEELSGETILLLGDSMTYGQGVENVDTFPKVLERLYGRDAEEVLVINGGGRGTSTIHQFETLKELYSTTSFNAVGFCFYLGNDSDNNYQHAEQPESIRAAITRETSSNSIKQALFAELALPNFVYMRLRALAAELNLIRWFSGKDLLRRDSTEREVEGWKITRDYVGQIRDFQEAHPETYVFFVMLPQDFQVDGDKQESYRLSEQEYDFFKPNRELVSILEDAQMPYVDMTPLFVDHYSSETSPKLYFPIDRHMNELGHKVVANSLHDFLGEHRLKMANAKERASGHIETF